MKRVLLWGVIGAIVGAVPGGLGFALFCSTPPAHGSYGPIGPTYMLMIGTPLGLAIGLVVGAIRARMPLGVLVSSCAGAAAGAAIGFYIAGTVGSDWVAILSPLVLAALGGVAGMLIRWPLARTDLVLVATWIVLLVTFRHVALHAFLGFPQPEFILSADGQLLAAAADVKRIEVWQRAADGGFQELASLKNSAISDYQRPTPWLFAPDGSLLVLAAGPTAKLVRWDPRNDKLEEWLTEPSRWDGRTKDADRWRAGQSPSGGKYLLVESKKRGGVVVWDPVERKEIAMYRWPPDDSHWGLNLSPNATIATTVRHQGGSESIELWDLPRNKPLHRLSGTHYPIHAGFSPDGRKLACADRHYPSDRGVGAIMVWDVRSGKEDVVIPGDAPVRAIAFSPDAARLAIADRAGALRIWDAATGKLQASYDGPSESDWRLAFTPDGASLIAAYSSLNYCWSSAEICRRSATTLELEEVLWRHDMRWQTVVLTACAAAWYVAAVGRYWRRSRLSSYAEREIP